jgi:DnaA-homolog protein
MVRYILTHHDRAPASLVALLERVDSLSLREQHRVTIPLIKRAMAGEV